MDKLRQMFDKGRGMVGMRSATPRGDERIMRPVQSVVRRTRKMRAGTTCVLLFVVMILGGAGDVADADIYRWTDEHGVVHYSNVREDVPPGVQVERLPDGKLPSPPTADPIHAPGSPIGTAPADPSEVAPAGLDVERFELQRRYREAKDRLTAIDQQLKTLATLIEGAPEGGEEAVANLETREAQVLALQRERATVSKQIDEVRTRYADLCRRASEANGGRLPVDWEPDLR